MTRNEWLALIQRDAKWNVRKEVQEWEFQAGLVCKAVYQKAVLGSVILVSKHEYEAVNFGPGEEVIMRDPAFGVRMNRPPSNSDSWDNVWHSVAEACWLTKSASVAPVAAYLAYCRGCRDWEPTPPHYQELPPEQQHAWELVALRARNLATEAKLREEQEEGKKMPIIPILRKLS